MPFFVDELTSLVVNSIMFYHLQSHISAARRSPRGVCEVLRLAARGAADGDAGDAGVGVAPARVNT